MTSIISKLLGENPGKTLVEIVDELLDNIMESSPDYAIDPKTKIYWVIPEGY